MLNHPCIFLLLVFGLIKVTILKPKNASVLIEPDESYYHEFISNIDEIVYMHIYSVENNFVFYSKIESCKGALSNIYVNYCYLPNPKVYCNPLNYPHLMPTRKTYDFKYQFDGKSQQLPVLGKILCGNRICEGNVSYIFGVEGKFLKSDFVISIDKKDKKDLPNIIEFTNDKTLEFNQNNILSWKNASICSKYDENFENCIEISILKHSVFYRYGYTKHEFYNANSGCGFDFHLIKNPLWVLNDLKDVLVLPTAKENYYMNVIVNAVNKKGEMFRNVYHSKKINPNFVVQDYKAYFSVFGVLGIVSLICIILSSVMIFFVFVVNCFKKV